ncbi:Rpn family recombination-promoting nuclease/putative transposase [Chitinispirillales bacterium ANBcel5]|uniref:Rpn family recombination-promoting nuclease/putative transposase n=1 Tax=Cellulosispirillum alkaliphilum TaxID=3039283 RepID=UPI002A56963A|nr:Rpn family recombination-promoting nuclease/putative transposase [Chitinispirillales bacterium ANBcel5]
MDTPKNNPLKNPHNAFFRETFSRITTARPFIDTYAPKQIRSQLDLSTLAIQKDSFVDKEFKAHYSDILYSVKLKGKSAFIYMLFEHKSYSDPWTGFQLLRNMVKIWEQYRNQHKKKKKLPIIVPMVIYHGAKEWEVTTSMTHLFEDIENTRDYIPEFKNEVYDISHIPDEEIRGEILLRVNFLILKYSRSPELYDKLNGILLLLLKLRDIKTKTEYFEILFRYLSAVVDAEDTEHLNREFNEIAQIGGVTMPTIAEKWFLDGKAEGKLEGKREGVIEGQIKTKIETAEKMIAMGMSDEQIEKITALGIEKIKELRAKKKSN